MVLNDFVTKYMFPPFSGASDYEGGWTPETETNDILLQNSTMIMNSVLDSTRSGIIATDAEKTIVIINKPAAEFFDVREEDVIGRSLEEALPDSTLNRVDMDDVVTVSSKLHVHGKVVLAYRAPLRVQDRLVGLIGVFQDITAYEATHKELDLVRKNEEFLEKVIANSYDGIFITDSSGEAVAVNEAYGRITGVPAKQLVGRNVRDLVNEGVISVSLTDEVVRKRLPVTQTQTIVNGKQVVITGSPVFDSNGAVVNVITNVRDVTELIALEKKLRITNDIVNRYQQEIFREAKTEDIISRSKSFGEAMELARKVAQMDSSVVITGETGVGKEIIAQYIHKCSARQGAPFIKVNCGAIPENLLESELFGYVPGAFTGASPKGKRGLFELADGGTLFLDEIGELPLELQSTLLRVLQDGEVVRVGGSKSHKVNVRIISATNRSLEDMIASGRFRSDLFYRLNVVAIHVPPLRERREDIPGLAEKQIRHLNDKYNQSKIITANFINGLMTLEWPGNVRELNNFIEKQFVISGSDIIDSFGDSAAHEAQAHDFFQPQAASVQAAGRDAFGHQAPHAGPEGQAEDQPPSVTVDGIMPMADARRELEKILISRAMAKGGSTHKAAALLKMSQPTFFRRYKELFPDGGDWDEEA